MKNINSKDTLLNQFNQFKLGKTQQAAIQGAGPTSGYDTGSWIKYPTCGRDIYSGCGIWTFVWDNGDECTEGGYTCRVIQEHGDPVEGVVLNLNF